MKLSGTIAHNRCTVIRLAELQEGSWASPNPEHRSSHSRGLRSPRYPSWLKGRFAVWYKENHLTLPCFSYFCKTLLSSKTKHCFFSSLQGHRICEGRRWSRPGKGEDRTLHALGGPAASPAGRCWITCTPPWADITGVWAYTAPTCPLNSKRCKIPIMLNLISKNKNTNSYMAEA